MAGRPKGSKNKAPAKTGPRYVNDCPRCGATPSHQKYHPAKTRQTVDMSAMGAVGTISPVDAVVCPYCGHGFRVVHLETWNGEIVNYRDEFECEPNYCPVCGRKLRERSE